MDDNKKRIAFLDLALAAVVLALFGLAPLSLDLRRDNPLPGQPEVGGTADGSNANPAISVGFTPSTYQISMETENQPVADGGIVADILDQADAVSISEPVSSAIR